MKKIRNILLLSIVLIGMVCALVLFFTINKQPLVSVDTKGKTMPTPMEVENVRSIGQWEFLTLTDEEIADTAKAFIDLGKIKRENIIKRGDRLEIILPDPEIMLTSTRIDHKSVKQKIGLFRHDFTDEEMTSLQGKGRNEIIESLSKTNIVTDARQNAARLIVPIAVQCGFKEENVTVTFRKDFHPGNFNTLIRQLK